MKHVGKMKNNNAKIVVAYRTIPNDPYHALVIGTGNLGDAYHDSLMSLVQDVAGQSANELADILAVRKFPDGSNMLQWFHERGYLRKVPTHMVLMTPTPQSAIQLDELNLLIAEQKGVSLEDLAVNDGETKQKAKKEDLSKTTSQSVSGEIYEETQQIITTEQVVEQPLNAAQLRSKADALYKEAAKLRKQADELDPPKKKAKSTKAEA